MIGLEIFKNTLPSKSPELEREKGKFIFSFPFSQTRTEPKEKSKEKNKCDKQTKGAISSAVDAFYKSEFLGFFVVGRVKMYKVGKDFNFCFFVLPFIPSPLPNSPFLFFLSS